MTQGLSRFEFQITKVEALLTQAAKQSNPAQWLYLHDLRTPVFMLEGLSKLYAELHNAKKFSKLKDRFKEIEDALGAIDYYASFQKEFSSNRKIPANIKSFLTSKTNESIETLNQILKEENWLDGKRIKKIREKLGEIKWLEEDIEISEMKKVYQNQIEKIKIFIADTTFTFDNVEEDIHELRRKLRWLSIYPQALQGVVKLVEAKPIKPYLKKYGTKEIIQSPFNKLPISKTAKHFLQLEKNHFLALSWIISELGKIKDAGLKIHVLEEALQHSNSTTAKGATQNVYSLLEKNYPRTETLLSDAGKIVKEFFDEGVLDNLLR